MMSINYRAGAVSPANITKESIMNEEMYSFIDYVRDIVGDTKAADKAMNDPKSILPLWDVYEDDYKAYCASKRVFFEEVDA
jgi:hypothetical protein